MDRRAFGTMIGGMLLAPLGAAEVFIAAIASASLPLAAQDSPAADCYSVGTELRTSGAYEKVRREGGGVGGAQGGRRSYLSILGSERG